MSDFLRFCNVALVRFFLCEAEYKAVNIFIRIFIYPYKMIFEHKIVLWEAVLEIKMPLNIFNYLMLSGI